MLFPYWMIPLGANLFLISLMALITNLFPRKILHERSGLSQGILGLLFGTLAVFSSGFPVTLLSGVHLDGSLCIPPLTGFFFGPFSVLLVTLILLIEKIVTSSLSLSFSTLTLFMVTLLGLACSFFVQRWKFRWVWLQLLVLGVAVASTTLLGQNISQAFGPAFLFYPVSILLIGMFLNAVQSKNQTMEELVHLTDQLKESETRFRFLAESSSDMITRHAADGTYEYASPASERLLGYRPEELLGHSAYDFVYPEDHQAVQNSHQNILADSVVTSVSYRGVRKDKTLIWLETTSHTILDPLTHQVFEIHASTRDISDRKQFEEQLQRSQASLEALLRTRRESIWAVDRQLNYTILNDFFIESYQLVFGLSLKPGMNALEILSEEHRNQWRPRYEAALRGEKQDFEFSIPFNQELSTFEVFLNPIWSGGTITGVSAISVDITERQRAAQALKTSENKYRMLFENLTLGFALHKMIFNEAGEPIDYRYLEVNPAFEKLTGLKAQQLVGKTVLEVLPHTEEHWIQVFGQVALTGVPFTYENYSQEFDKYFETISFRPEEGHFAVLFSDITERKKAEEQRRQLDLEINKMQKLESLGILAGGIAHDFNNLLTGIYMNLEMARQSTPSSPLLSYLDTAGKTMDRARNLTKQLLTFSKGGVPHKKVEALGDLLQETVAFALSGSSVASDFHLAPNLWLCELDKAQISQVMENLVINALQAMPKGGMLKISAKNQVILEGNSVPLKPGRYVQVSVQDTGTGIPPELVTKIFDPFFTTKANGHGLGLATCFSILKKHSGHIEVFSKPGEGTTFHFYLPASTEKESFEPSKPLEKHQGKGKFLILDDEEVIRDILEKVLQQLGYTPLSYDDGDRVLEAFHQDQTDKKEIVGMIFDLTIPGKTGGREIIDKIREWNRSIPIFVFSGYAEDEILVKPTQFGFTASLSKPFGIEEMKRLLNQYLRPLEKT